MAAKYTVITEDWKDAESVVKQLVKIMRANGIKVYDMSGGSDSISLIISKKKLSKATLKSIMYE